MLRLRAQLPITGHSGGQLDNLHHVAEQLMAKALMAGLPDTPGPRAATTPTASNPAGKGSRLVASLVPKYRPDVKLMSDAFTPAHAQVSALLCWASAEVA